MSAAGSVWPGRAMARRRGRSLPQIPRRTSPGRNWGRSMTPSTPSGWSGTWATSRRVCTGSSLTATVGRRRWCCEPTSRPYVQTEAEAQAQAVDSDWALEEEIRVARAGLRQADSAGTGVTRCPNCARPMPAGAGQCPECGVEGEPQLPDNTVPGRREGY